VPPANALDPLRNPSSPAVAKWGPLAAGVVAAALASWIRCPAPPPHSLSWRDLAGFAITGVLVTFIASAMVVLTAYATLSRWADLEVPGITLRTALASVWLAPLAVFLAGTSSWSMAVTAVLVASVTQLVCSRRELPGHGAPKAPGDLSAPQLFRQSREPPLIERLLPALCASVSVQAGGIAALTGHIFPAAALSGVGTAVIAWRSGTSADYREPPPRKSARPTRRAGLVLALATILTAAGLTPYLAVQRESGWGGGAAQKLAGDTRAFLRSIIGGEQSHLDGRPDPRSNKSAVKVGDVYAGIILLPEFQPHPTIVPPLPALHYGSPQLGPLNPLSIPFFGAYWFFKAPDSRPPQNAVQARGSPAEHTFASTDHAPLSMEAHQNFGVLFDLDCCKAIQLAVTNADRYIGTVTIELILVNSRLPGRPSQSLGTAPLESAPHRRPGDDSPISETLTFAIPPVTAIRKFDEVTVCFKLATLRADTAAKTAIDRFLFVPK